MFQGGSIDGVTLVFKTGMASRQKSKYPTLYAERDEIVQYDNLIDVEDDLDEEFDDDMHEELKEAMCRSILQHQ